MCEFFYELIFTPSYETYQDFVEIGYLTGCFILIIITLLTSGIFYFYFGKISEKYARVGKWFFSLILTILLVFIITVYWISFKIFLIEGWANIPNELWMFSLVNAFYAGVLFFLISLLFKQFSSQSYKIPF